MIYFVEDDESIRKLVVYTLKSQDMEAYGFETPSEFYSALNNVMPNLVLLDVMLPEESGLDILYKLRNSVRTSRLPIIIISARGSEYDRILGLDSGADDYISKPFSMMELVSRIKALLRRIAPEKADFCLGELEVRLQNHSVEVSGEEIPLTLKEFDTLVLLLQEQGHVLTRGQILNQIWGYDFDGTSRTVDVHIRTLRQKLGVAGSYIKTVRGIGYQIERV